MNLAGKLHENIQKNRRLDQMENGEIEVTQAERDDNWNWWIEHSDDLNDALEAAGILVICADSPCWFPHPDWLDRLSNLGLSEEDSLMVIDYVEEHWPVSLRLLSDIEATGIERAITAYAKRAKQKGFVFQQPDQHLSTGEEQTGRMFVVLRNVNGELARFEATPKWNEDGEQAGFKLRHVEPRTAR